MYKNNLTQNGLKYVFPSQYSVQLVLGNEIHKKWYLTMSWGSTSIAWNGNTKSENVARTVKSYTITKTGTKYYQEKKFNFNGQTNIKKYFNKSVTLSYFNPGITTWIFVDATKVGRTKVFGSHHFCLQKFGWLVGNFLFSGNFLVKRVYWQSLAFEASVVMLFPIIRNCVVS